MTWLLPRDLHSSRRPSVTAEVVTAWRALELERPVDQRIVSDRFAPVFLAPLGQAALATAFVAAPLLRVAARAHLVGVWGHVLCRHRFIDEHLLAALADGAGQVVVLGAGYDSRAYRFADILAGRPVFEVDLPPLSQRKARIVAARPEVFGPTAIRRVEIDFRTQSLADRLVKAGFAPGVPTFVVWEGVAPYLSREAVVATLDTLNTLCGKGSRIAMDLWDGVGGQGWTAPLRRLGAGTLALVGEPFTFGMPPSQVASFLDAHGFTLTDLAGGDELAARYSTDGRPCEASLYVLAAHT